jgi:hypothetical protein
MLINRTIDKPFERISLFKKYLTKSHFQEAWTSQEYKRELIFSITPWIEVATLCAVLKITNQTFSGWILRYNFRICNICSLLQSRYRFDSLFGLAHEIPWRNCKAKRYVRIDDILIFLIDQAYQTYKIRNPKSAEYENVIKGQIIQLNYNDLPEFLQVQPKQKTKTEKLSTDF